MKRAFSILCLLATGLFMITSCHSNASTSDGAAAMNVSKEHALTYTLTGQSDKYPVFKVSDTLHDFGTVKQGDVVKCAFYFKNTGSKALIIRRAASTCGCTVPEYPKKPVPPGADGVLKVVFHSAGKMGRQVKPIFIEANTRPRQIHLEITCNVVKPQKKQD